MVPWPKRLKRALRYWAIRLAAALFGALPIRLAARLGETFGALAYMLARGERAKALASLATAYPSRSEPERRALALAMFRHLGRSVFELVCVAQIDQNPEAFIEWPQADQAALDAALARKKGVLFISGHIGNWELLARRVALAGYPCQTIAKETSDPRLTQWVETFRASAKLKAIWRGRPSAVKDMLRALKHGEILGLLIDQDTNVQSVWVPFFGQLAKTPRAAADLALRTGAAVMLGFCQRQASGRYRLRMHELTIEPNETPESLTARMTSGIEAAIREHPEQWVWLHRRWRSLPS